MVTLTPWQNWTTASTTADTVWYNWTSSSTTASIAYDISNVWHVWADSTTSYAPYRRPPETAEQREARERANQARLDREAEAQRQREEAVARAEQLLLANLTKHQRRTYRNRQCFNVRAESGKKYRIKVGWSHNVESLDSRHRAEATYCAHPAEQVPNQDNMLAQKLLLETDEQAFLRTANRGAVLVRR